MHPDVDKAPLNRTDYRGKWNIKEVAKTIQDGVAESIPQVRSIAKSITMFSRTDGKRLGLEVDANEVWRFIRENVRYVEDRNPDGSPAERIKVAARTLQDGEGDCEDMTILASALLINMGHSPRGVIIKQSGPQWSHIFAAVGDKARPSEPLLRGWVIDAVPEIGGFDEAAPTITKVMEIEFLRGVRGAETPVINGYGCIGPASSVTSKLQGYQSALLGISGIGSVEAERGRELRKTRALVLMNGLPEQAILMPVMDHVHDVTPEGVLVFAPDAPLGAIADYLEAVDAEGIAGIGRKQKQDKLRKDAAAEKAANAKKKPADVRKQNEGILKKAGKAIVRYNPVTIAARNGLLLAMRLNLFKIAENLHYGYLTDAQAGEAGLDASELAKVRGTLREVEKIFTAIGGKVENLRSAILKGGEKGLKGIGVVVAATATAGTAAATPFLVKIANLIKKLNLKKLVEKVNPGKLIEKLKKAKADSVEVPDDDAPATGPAADGFKTTEEQQGYEASQRQSGTTTTENTSQDGDAKKDNTLLYVGLAAAGIFALTKIL